MAKQRAPRRTLKLTRYLESVLVDPKASAAMKATASGRLTELFLADAAAKARKEIALERAAARVELARLEKAGVGTTQTDGQPLEAADANAVPQNNDTVKARVDEYLARTIAGKV